jgi:cellulose synthase (UDP-forming)
MPAPETLDVVEQTMERSASRTSAVAEHATYTLPTGAYPVVEADASSERLTHAVALLMLAYTTFYILWRWFFTLNTAALWFSVPLALAETYGLVTAFFMTYTTWTLKRRVAPPAPRGLTVDVFVTTYDEPLNVIRKTALAAREIRYPHTTYILDDGKRDEIRGLAEDLGVEYVRRADNRHAKAGNLNHALSQSSGDFILQLDADHVPQPHILDRLLGFFADDRVAFAQSPQDFYNTDAFTYDVNETARRIWEDQQLFFRIIQPGKDARDAAFFVGSCAVLRRAALEDIGGFATTTITEDIETSLLLHSKGWRSVFYGETLAYGLAPGSAAAFHTQHLRWGQGAMQALRRYQPLSMRGLTLAQRIGYFDSLTTYFAGFQRIVFYLAPAIFFFTGAFPVRAGALPFFLIFAPYIALQFLAFKRLSRGHGSLLLADRYGMAKFFTHLVAVTAYFSKGALKFRVTPKGITDVPFRTYAPQLGLAVLTGIAVVWGVIAASTGVTSYDVPGWGSMAFYVNFVFAAWTFYSSMYIVDMSVRLKSQRQDHRYAEMMPVEIKVLREGRHVRSTLLGVTNDLNPNGLAFRSSELVDDGAWVEMRLPLLTRPVDVKGRVVHRSTVETRHGEMHHHGVEFVALSWDVRDAIELHCAHYTTPLRRQRYVQAFSAMGDALRWVRDPRRAARAAVGMPVDVELRSGTNWAPVGLGLWEDVSDTGARLLLADPLNIGDHVRVRVRGKAMQFDGDIVFVRTLETALGARFVVGLRRPRTQALQHVSPQTRGLPVNWNKFDRLLNRTRTGEAATMTDVAPAAPRDASTAATNGIHVEVLRPKAVAPPDRDEADRDEADRTHELELEAAAISDDTDAPNVEAYAEVADDESAAWEREAYEEESAEAVAGAEAETGYRAAPEELPRWMAGVEEFQSRLQSTSPQRPAEPPIPAMNRASSFQVRPEQTPFAPPVAPIDDAPINIAPTEIAPIDSAPIDSAPIDSAPIDNAPIDIAPMALPLTDAPVPIAPAASQPPFTPAPRPRSDAHAAETAYDDRNDSAFNITQHETGADEMMTEQIMQTQSAKAATFGPPSETSMLTVWGGGARLDGKFEIDDSIEVRCELSGELSVGGRVVIEEGGNVNATIRTVDAEIRGTFSGDLIATGSVQITETGRVNGNIQTEELIIARGGFFNGNVTRPEEPEAPARNSSNNARQASAPRNGAAHRGGGPNGRSRTQEPPRSRDAHADEQESLRPRLRQPEEPGLTA